MWRRIKAGVFLIVATAIVLFAVSIVIQTDDLNMLSDAFPDFGETTMMRALGLAAGGLLVLITAVGPSTAAEQQFSCKGQVIQEMVNPAVPQKPIDFSVILSEKNKMSIKTSDNKTLVPRVTSNNKIQLKFVTKEFVGEYFHYSGDLFLIYRSGQLARMNCTRI